MLNLHTSDKNKFRLIPFSVRNVYKATAKTCSSRANCLCWRTVAFLYTVISITIIILYLLKTFLQTKKTFSHH